MQRATTERRPATFRGLPRGSYLVVAGHRDCLEGRTEVFAFEGIAGKEEYAKATLGAGAAIRAVAKDGKGAPAGGIELQVDRVGEPAASLLNDHALRESRAHRTGSTDETGRMKLIDLDSGSSRIHASLTGRRRDAQFGSPAREGPCHLAARHEGFAAGRSSPAPRTPSAPFPSISRRERRATWDGPSSIASPRSS